LAQISEKGSTADVENDAYAGPKEDAENRRAGAKPGLSEDQGGVNRCHNPGHDSR
jgi:hypothetical protein